MGYFDNPKHRAEWERELSSLREQKARLHGDASAASYETEREVSREYEKTAYEQDFSEEYSESEYSEEYSTANDYSEPVREERSEPVREEVRSEPVREERSEPVREEVRPAPAREEFRSAPVREERSSRVNVHPDEEYRIRMTFQELLEMENIAPVHKTTSKPHEMQRQKEVSHAL
ncbi:MAG: hypothetical protein ACI4JY_07530 [Oscillospiraceae bacterium]